MLASNPASRLNLTRRLLGIPLDSIKPDRALENSIDVKRTSQTAVFGPLNWADFRSFPGQRRNAQSACESGPSRHLLGAALVERVRGFLQDILQIFVKFPSNNIDSFVAKLPEGRNRPIVFKCNAALGTFQKQDPNGGVESS
jgi:hypothetical protein